MIELVANIVITVSSVLLFCYWSRCACALIRNQKATLNFGMWRNNSQPRNQRPPANFVARAPGMHSES
jgi:hypothetical protein